MPSPAINGRRLMARCDALARHSEEPGKLTRVFLSAEHRAAADALIGWMREAGMQAGMDAIGNVVGRYEGTAPGLPCLLLGSHLDTVRDAGRYDGMLGVVTAIECVQAFADVRQRFPFAIEIAAFGDEEGTRFGTTLLGSRAMAGTFDPATLDVRDRDGISIAQALRDFGLDPGETGAAAKQRSDLLAYVEVHIEQGPVLESLGLPVGVVTAINGFSRLHACLAGTAGHAGTVPMALRHDALAGAAECILALERIAAATPDLVGTVGRIEALPGALNVIPGKVSFTLDIRAPDNLVRNNAVRHIGAAVRDIAARRKLVASIETLQEQNVATCANWLLAQLDEAIQAEGHRLHRLPSGAGHDGMAMQAITDFAMLFVRCKDGISHNPAESITESDAAAGARVLAHFIQHFKAQNS